MSSESESTNMGPARTSPEGGETSSENLKSRKGHKKSRGGCFNCKRRKIKCQENQPACHNCVRIKISCTYPPTHILKPLQRQSSPSLDILTLQSTPTIFNASDMRLFHHSITTAYPHLPLGNDSVWVRDIPTFSHSYSFLLQAMLAISASHLSVCSTSPLTTSALTHLHLAISGLNTALSTPPRCQADADAILATCFILSSTTMYLGESVEEFFTMMRGIILVMSQNWTGKYGTSFLAMTHGAQDEIILSRMKDLSLLPVHLVAEARDSVERMENLEMKAGSVEEKIFAIQRDIVRAASVSSLEAYRKYKEIHNMVNTLPNSEFQAFIEPSNAVAQILLAHYVALIALITPIKAKEWEGRCMGTPKRHTVFRMDGIWSNVPEDMRGYLYWPMKATGSIPGIKPYLQIMYP